FIFVFFLCTRCTPLSTLFPYTTLFRSSFVQKISMNRGASWRTLRTCSQRLQYCWLSILLLDYTGEDRSNPKDIESTTSSIGVFRSEEHTSELQSRFDLVCRLLLEKKKY